jgi:hypothetical protein
MVQNNPEAADLIDKALKDKTPFDQVARTHDELNRAEGGLKLEHTGPLDEFEVSGWENVNLAVRQLKTGEHTGRLDVGNSRLVWAVLAELGSGSKSLQEVYLEIEQKLRSKQIKHLQDAYRIQLLRQHITASVNDMVKQLLLVALTRYTALPGFSSEEAEEGAGS